MDGLILAVGNGLKKGLKFAYWIIAKLLRRFLRGRWPGQGSRSELNSLSTIFKTGELKPTLEI